MKTKMNKLSVIHYGFRKNAWGQIKTPCGISRPKGVFTTYDKTKVTCMECLNAKEEVK